MNETQETTKKRIPTWAKVLIVVLAVVLMVGGIAVAVVRGMLPDAEAPDVSGNSIYAGEDGVSDPTPTLEPERTMIPEYADLYAQNPDIVGWIKIEGTQLDYPVMYTPDDPQKYLYLGFDQKWSGFGSIFIDETCTVDLENDVESENLLMHGHNMINGSMFRTITKYRDKSFWEEHPIIQFDTLYEHREYEVLAAFDDRIYYKYETAFRYYQFIDVDDEATFNDGISQIKAKGTYDTGVTAEYGDKLITLSTCSGRGEYGRYVVVARLIENDDTVAEEASSTT